jgi:hypothetical protein
MESRYDFTSFIHSMKKVGKVLALHIVGLSQPSRVAPRLPSKQTQAEACGTTLGK